ncbi:hypothetical protein M0R72_14300 [Candidatus Pacearchaeota archaeon]|nr:hypothetical protein [Candidatus Pacearchaeota archaeon]
MIGKADLITAINAVWDASTLNASFQALWAAGVVGSDFPVLHDQEASPDQPYPYVVMEISTGSTTDRMSGGASSIREIRDVPCKFNIYAQDIAGDVRSSKQIAADLAEEVMKVFGGHPTQSPTGSMELTNSNHLITSYQDDYGILIDTDKYQWIVSYVFKVDVPVAV